MASDEIHIYEENTHIIWGLVAVVALAMATYLLANAFMSGSWQWGGYRQLGSLLLFSLGMYGIVRITTPLLHFVLSVSGSTLSVQTWREDTAPLHVQQLDLQRMSELRIAPHTPRARNEAFFDFSPDYHLYYRNRDEQHFRPLIDLENESFTLRVEDLRDIITFLQAHAPALHVPDEPQLFMAAR